MWLRRRYVGVDGFWKFEMGPCSPRCASGDVVDFMRRSLLLSSHVFPESIVILVLFFLTSDLLHVEV
jgi:hypothetical protein